MLQKAHKLSEIILCVHAFSWEGPCPAEFLKGIRDLCKGLKTSDQVT